METVTELLGHLASRGIKLSVNAGKLNCHAQKGTLTSDLQAGIVAHKAALIALLEVPQEQAPLPDAAVPQRLPLSFAQERLWFLNELDPGSTGYSVPIAVSIGGELDVAQLERAINVIIARHENLRTVFPSEDGRAYQRILERVDFQLERVDLSQSDVNHCLSPDAREREARELCLADAAKPFDLAGGPLLRGKVIRLAEEEHILLLNLHHIISDGWSLGILIRELGAIMDAFRAGRNPELPPLPIQYADYAIWQRQWLEEDGVLEEQLGYWRQKLAGVPESLDLFTDHPRPNVQSFEGASYTFSMDARLTARLKAIAEEQGGTLFMVLLAAFQALLHRYTGQNDICVGAPIANRQHGETEGLIGMFVNTLALRSRVEADETFMALLAKVRHTCLEAYENQDAPFEKVIDMLRPQRSLAVSPLVQVMLILQNAPVSLPDPRIRHYPFDSGVSKLDLTVELTEAGGGLDGRLEYSTALYEPQTIARLARHFTALCQAIAAAPTAEIRALDYLGEAEKHLLLAGYNATQTEYPTDLCLPDLFAAQVARTPERTAVVCGDGQLTYRELDEKSRDLALYLQSEGVRPDSLVGVCMERSLEMVVALYGILRAGGAYVPLDPDYPDDRLEHMVSDSRAAIVLTQEKLRGKLATLVAAETRLLALDTQWPEIPANVVLRQDLAPSHLAYVIYTSGSTGRPKGVMNEHRGVVNRLLWMQDAYGLSKQDAVLQKTPFSFDVSVWEFFWPLFTGATLVMARPEGHKDPAYLADIIRQHQITTLHFVPSMLQVFLEHGEASECVSLSRVVCSGEALPSAFVRRFAERLPHATLYNLYGPTEAAVDVTEWICPKTDIPNAIPIGHPIANTQIYILDQYGAPVPVGVAGELHIAGVQVARGYLNRAELTAERFVHDPFSTEAGARMYKTGDLARWQDDGNIEYLGRNDFQVKLRGFRIELGEIEARLTEHEAVREAVVVAREDRPGDKRLVAYYTSSPEHQVSSSDIRTFLGEHLPEYMVPAVFVPLDEMPLSPNGKLDRKALPAPELGAIATREYEPPQGEIEETLAAICQELLHVERVGRNDDFFELGGHSLLATQLISKIRSRLDVALPLKAVFEGGSIARLGRLIAAAAKNDVPPILPADRSRFDRLPLSFAQERLWFLSELDPESAGYNVPASVRIRGEVDADELDRALNLIIARHENLRTVFPSEEGRASQRILERVDFRLERIDCSDEETRPQPLPGRRGDAVRSGQRSAVPRDADPAGRGGAHPPAQPAPHRQ